MKVNLGIDIGRSDVKVTTLDNKIKFPSYCGKARILDFENEKEEYILMVDNEEYFIGELAKREGMSRGFQKEKVDNERTLPLTLAAIYLSSPYPEIEASIVCGTPISDYQNQKERIERYLKGNYEVKIKGKSKKYIAIDNVKVFPEGAGCFFSKVLSNNGEVIDKELATSKVGIVDIGYKTTDICIFENLKLVDQASVSFNYGVYQAYNLMYKRLVREQDIMPEQVEIIKAGPEFEQLANNIRTNIKKFWGNTNFTIFLAGGGSHILSQYFQKFIKINEPEYSNSIGYFKISQMLFKPQKLIWNIK